MAGDPSEGGVAEQTLAKTAAESGKAKASDFSLFFRKFLDKGRGISSAVPSSRSMVEGVLSPIDFDRPATIIELGAGTGPITEMVNGLLRPHHRFVAVENDADFCRILERRFPDTPLIQADASRVAEPLRKLGIEKVDYVLSGLPSPNLPARAQVRLWRWLHQALNPGGLFIQITVAPLVYRGFYKRLFESVDYSMIWMNVPPGGVYYCSKPRRHLHRNGRGPKG